MDERLGAIRTALDYIEAHLLDPVSVADIAAAAGYSLYHFIRTFNQTVHHTPYDYLMRRRLAEAGRALLAGNRRVIDIAFEYQFNNHETFTRAFRRIFGMPPSSWRDTGQAAPWQLMPALDQDYLDYLNSGIAAPPEVLTLDETTLAGLMAPIRALEADTARLWSDLRGVLKTIPHKHAQIEIRPAFWGIHTPPHTPAGTGYYFAGVQTTHLETILPPLAAQVLPAGDYISLTQPPGIRQETILTYLYHTYIPKTDLTCSAPTIIKHFTTPPQILLPVQT